MPTNTQLPPPFNQVPGVGLGTRSITISFSAGSTPLTRSCIAGRPIWRPVARRANGDNLLEIHDTDVATVFAIEALGLVDHFDFLDLKSANRHLFG